MTPLERRAARLVCTGFSGDDPETVDVAALAELGPGGLILFARNVTTPERTRALVERVAAAIAARTGERPFAGVDQEGGRVARLSDGEAEMPSAMAIGAAGDEALAGAAGRAIAGEVRRFGCDVDFAPNLDLALDARSRVVGTRSFGDDPARVGALGAAFARGLAAGGVAAVAKHAPGHGSTGTDSHDALPVLAAGSATLVSRDLAPFCQVVASGTRAVMFAHVVVPELGERPSSLNAAAVSLVRDAVGPGPVFFTDCLQMAAVAASVGTAEAAALAIGAGIDIAIVSHDVSLAAAAARAIARDVAAGTIPVERFEAAVAAASRFRAYVRSLDADAGRPEGRLVAREAVAAEVARAALTWLRRGDATPPAFDVGEAVTVVSFEGRLRASAEGQGLARRPAAARPSLGLALRRRRVRAEVFRVPLEPDGDEIEALDLILAGQGARAIVVVARAARHAPAQARAIAAVLARAPEALVVCAGEPFDLVAVPAARRVVATYGDGAAEMEAVADLLIGARAATGRSPVRAAAAS